VTQRPAEPVTGAEAAAQRRRRPLLAESGRLMIIAADHPARGALDVRGVTGVMANRYDLLERLVVALARPGVDGVLATPDIVDDLLLLGALDEKVVIGSMNRAGLQGARFEIDDRFTAYDAPTIARMRLDGGKMLCRIDHDDSATAGALEACSHAVSTLGGHRLMAMVEPFLSRRVQGRVTNDLSAPAVVKSVAIAAGLGTSSAYTWLKLPVVDGMEQVMEATTLPTLILGGDPTTEPEQVYGAWSKALALPGVRGLVVGRSLLYPPDEDVAAAVDAAVALL
jgi:DhnA family fructose-bisphosphate aldolase class Ia